MLKLLLDSSDSEENLSNVDESLNKIKGYVANGERVEEKFRLQNWKRSEENYTRLARTAIFVFTVNSCSTSLERTSIVVRLL